MRRLLIASAVALLLASAGAVHAQLPIDIELRGGAAFPAEDLGDTELKTGGGAGLTLQLRLLPEVAVYGGWDWFMFAPKGTASELDLTNTGYAFGVQLQRSVYGNVGGWVRAGGIYTHIEIEDGNGTLVSDSGHELGWEAGGGLRVPIAYRIALVPGVRYRTVSLDLDDEDGTLPVDLSYVTAELGFQLTLGPSRSIAALRR